ncbi:MAG: RnfABCDGE type electron transport complex subunit D [Proteobacteria bacterium]|nr:RnfABCDGE type electron transport complex subunit D [Pseudomonadota bacterium]
MRNILSVSFAPHIQERTSIRATAYRTIGAAAPAVLVGFYYFGWRAIIVTILAMLSAMATEAGIQRLMGQEPSYKDGTAALTGLLLAMLLPSATPWWAVIIGTAVAMFIGRMLFGGYGANPFNTALVGLVVLQLSWPHSVNVFYEPTPLFQGLGALSPLDASELPLGILGFGDKGGILDMYPLRDALIGGIPGGIGSTSVIALALGGLYLIWKKIVAWQIPAGFLGGMFVFALICWYTDSAGETYANPFYHLIFGYSMIGAFFLAPELTTSPYTSVAAWLYGIGAGVLTMIIRYWGANQEGVIFAILFLNALTPMLDRLRVPSYGRVKTA